MLIGRCRYPEIGCIHYNRVSYACSRDTTGQMVRRKNICTLFKGELGHATELLSVLQKIAEEDGKIKASFTIRPSKVCRFLRVIQGC